MTAMLQRIKQQRMLIMQKKVQQKQANIVVAKLLKFADAAWVLL